ncbi:YxeA family protein [Lactococcus lactis]|uniref:YxeA family protein n=1 Tax=Lactococcus lactis TaxID=1358 RepID=UPI0032E42FED
MKKIMLATVLCFGLISFLGYNYFTSYYQGEKYYVKIKKDGLPLKPDHYKGKTYQDYDYIVSAYNKKGEQKQLEFTADHKLKHNAYLELIYKKNKGVMSWEEIKKSKVPNSALKNLLQ